MKAYSGQEENLLENSKLTCMIQIFIANTDLFLHLISLHNRKIQNRDTVTDLLL